MSVVIPLCSVRSTHTFSTSRKSLSASVFFLYASEDKAKILLMFSNPAFEKEVRALLKFSSIAFNNRVIYSIESKVIMWRMIEEIGKDECRQPIISISHLSSLFQLHFVLFIWLLCPVWAIKCEKSNGIVHSSLILVSYIISF